MCELLAMSFNQPVNPKFSFTGFRYRGDKNPDGWGLAYYPDDSAQVIKEPIKARSSLLSEFFKDYYEMLSKIFVGHVRFSSVGSKSRKNTHPFYRELFGKEHVFAHNGTLKDYKDLKTGDFKPIGSTDSEHVFCYLLNCIKEENISKWHENELQWIAKKLHKINIYGKFNCIFSEGNYLFCYFDDNSHNGLHFLHRKPPYGKITLSDEDWKINLEEEKNLSQTGFIIATSKLTDEHWETFNPGELIVIKDGVMVYSNSRIVKNNEQNSQIEKRILRTLRESSSRVSLKEITIKTELLKSDVHVCILQLLKKKLIRQDRRDHVPTDHKQATFYTNPEKRQKIDDLLNK